MAGQLLERAVAELRRTKRKAVVTCSYAENGLPSTPNARTCWQKKLNAQAALRRIVNDLTK
jgi:predicted GNAT family acetyltransferase